MANIDNSDFIGNQHSANSHCPNQVSRAEADQKLKVSERNVNTAKKVQNNAEDESHLDSYF